MAFDDELSPTPQQSSPLSDLEGASLFALILQFIAGLVSVLYAVPGAVALLIFLGLGVPIPATTWIYFGAWLGLSLLCWIQLYYGYHMYKRTPGAVLMALRIDAIACILYGVDVVMSALEGSLLIFPEVMAYLAINIVVFLLLTMSSVKETFEGVPSSYGADYFVTGN